MGPLLGRFDFDLSGRTAYAYSLDVLFVLFLLARRDRAFAVRPVADGDPRQPRCARRRIGMPVDRRLIAVYTLAAAYAGAAGALLAQTTGFASLDVLEFHRSADVLLMLIIGGAGWLYGGIAGAIVFKLLQDVLSAITPQYWMFWIGPVPGRAGAGRPRAADRRGVRGLRRARRVRPMTRRWRRAAWSSASAASSPPTTSRFRLEKGARHALIGPNGAGKTTLVNLLTGVLPPSAGRIAAGRRGHHAAAPAAARAPRPGAHLPDQPAVRRPDAAGDAGARRRRAAGRRARRWWRPLGGDARGRARSTQWPTRFGLADVLDERTDTLPYGKQRLLEIAVALACAPRVLLLDEPAAGVPAAERQDILDAIAALPADVSVLLIEHDMDLVFSFAKRISVLVDGALLTEGTPQEIAADPRVRAVYLGESRADG